MADSIGVDWAGDGWLSLVLHDGDGVPIANTHSSLREAWEYHGGASEINRLCVDVPIGIPQGAEERPIDKECRSRLKRTSSVFRVPVREALEQDTQQKASRESRRVTSTESSEGVGVQPPAFSIRNQILEANKFAQSLPSSIRAEKLYEVHPELCFYAFSGESPEFSKKTAQGVAERLLGLDEVIRGQEADSVFGETMRSIQQKVGQKMDVAPDDVLDALSALFTAVAPLSEFWTLSEKSDSGIVHHRMAYRSEKPI